MPTIERMRLKCYKAPIEGMRCYSCQWQCLGQNPQEGLTIIESKSKSRTSRIRANIQDDTDAPLSNSSSSNNSFEMPQIDRFSLIEDKMTIKMNQMMNQMKAFVATPAPVKAVEERCTTCGNNHSFSVCPMTRGSYEYPVYHDNFQQFQQTASVGNFVQNGNSGYRAPNLANQMRPPGFNQPNPQASRQGYNANQGYNGNRNVNQTNQVNHGANSGLSQQAQAYQVPSTQAPVTYSRFEAYTKANDATLNNLQKNLNDFKKEQQDFQNEQRNFQNICSNMFHKANGKNNTSSFRNLPSTYPSTNPRGEVRAITTRKADFLYTPVPQTPIPHQPLYDVNEPLTRRKPRRPRKGGLTEAPKTSNLRLSKNLKIRLNRVDREKKDSNDKVGKFKEVGNVQIDSLEHYFLAECFDLECLNSVVNRLAKAKLFVISEKTLPYDQISHIFPNNNFEDSFTMGNEDLNFVPNKELDKEILIPIPRESKIGKDCDFPSCDDFQSFKTFSNPLFEKEDDFPSRNDESILKGEVHTETFKSYLNPLFEDDEEIISNEASSKISPKVDVKTIMSFFAPIGNCVRKWATSEFVKDNVEISHEVFKNDSENSLGIHDDKEEEIAFLDGLLEDENFFEMNDKKDESFESKTKEDFETKVEPEKKKELQVFHPDIEILDHLETTSYVGSDYVFYEDFNLVDMIFPMNIQGKIFDPGITFHEKSFEKVDKSSKELAPSKALLTLDVFDPLHPPLMDFNVTKAFSEFTFSILKFFSKKFFEPGIKNAKVWICQISQEISQKRTRERMSDQEAKEIKSRSQRDHASAFYSQLQLNH
ncbi:hypothetical protein Tco_1403497, partial [Tanacetum coccineum]